MSEAFTTANRHKQRIPLCGARGKKLFKAANEDTPELYQISPANSKTLET